MSVIRQSDLDQMYQQLQNLQVKRSALAQAVGTQVALGGSLPGVPKTPSPSSISGISSNEGSPSMPASSKVTNERRLRGIRGEIDAVRICDLQAGDKVGFHQLPTPDAQQRTDGVIVEKDNQFGLIWTDQGAVPVEWARRDTRWVAATNSTVLVKNWLGQDHGLIFLPDNRAAQGSLGVDFDSVILPADKKKEITDAISQIDNHGLIFDQWGFSDVFEKGTAISLLFYGPPGTGKTLMGQAIADKYGYKLEIISTAEIETPEPGGAERNIKEYFEKASSGKTVLLFDECDSLITDRHRVGMILAAQINALLTELERFTGIAIFTTNRLAALDPAFERRLSLKLEFPMPDKKHRVLIWKRMFPAQAPLADNIRWEDLASIEIAGGHIKNVVLKAARMAAAAKATEITDEILWEAMEKEIASMEAYHEEMNNNKQWYGTPIQGGVGAMDVNRERGKRSLG